MEKQNNSEMNNNTNVNEVKQPKKKMKTSTIVIIVLVVLLLFSCVGNMGGSGSSSSSTTTTTTIEGKSSEEPTEEEETTESEVEEAKGQEPEFEKDEIEGEETEVEELAVEEVPERDSSHFYVGDTLTYESGTTVTITDVGIIPSNYYDVPVLYMDMEIHNQLDKPNTWYSQSFSVYIDDYQIETSPVSIEANDDFDPFETTINPGRKAKFKFTSKLPSDYDGVSKIEIELPGGTKTLLVKDNGVYLYGREEPVANGNNGWDANEFDQSWYGEYARLDGSGHALRIDPDEVGGTNGIITVDGEYQYLIGVVNNGSGTLYLPISDDDVEAGSVVFGLGGLQLMIYSYSEFNGFYH